MDETQHQPPYFTPVQQAMMDLLNDGEPHTKAELRTCLWDELGESTNAVNYHLCKIRKKLLPIGRDILVQFIRGRYHFRQVQLLRPLPKQEAG